MGVGSHHFLKCLHIVEQDIAVDVCHDHVEKTRHVGQDGGVSKHHLHIVHMVEFCVVFGVVGAPFVNVVAHNVLGAQLGCGDAQDARSASAVEHALSFGTKLQERFYHHCVVLCVPVPKPVWP